MKLPLTVARLLQKLLNGVKLSGTCLKQPIIQQLADEGIIQKIRTGKSRYQLYLINNQLIEQYLNNHFGIKNLHEYIDELEHETLTRASLVNIGSSSKLKKIRSFKGFLVNSFEPIKANLNNQPFVIEPLEGSFTFIYDYKNFKIDEQVTVIGIENAENFRFVQQQAYLFEGLQVLFIARYPQTQHKDVIKWLQKIPNQYLHFGDIDFEGINIYLREYKKYLKEKARFFIPPSIEKVLQLKGNRTLYNNQLTHQPNIEQLEELALQQLIALLHQYKACLEQEAFIKF